MSKKNVRYVKVVAATIISHRTALSVNKIPTQVQASNQSLSQASRKVFLQDHIEQETVHSCYVIINWSRTSSEHIRNLTGAAASADERNILLYLTMRFAKTVRQIQGLQAYHSGDKLNVEVDIVLDEDTNLRDSHDLGESLQYVIESVPNGESETCSIVVDGI